MCEKFSSQPDDVLQVTGQFSAFTNCINIFYFKPANITQVVGQFGHLLMLAGHWSVFGCVRSFPHNLLMFCRFLDSYFNVISLSDVGRSLDSFQMHGFFLTTC